MGRISMRILRKPEVAKLTGYSVLHLDKLCREGRFVRKVPLGQRAVGYLEEEVLGWIKDRVAERDLVEPEAA